MKVTKKHKNKMAKLKFALVYPMYLKKVEKKGRNKHELDEIITWLTDYSADEINELVESEVNFEEFFKNANLNPKSDMITGVICGYRVEEIEDDLVRKVRYLDKLVDELSKGKSMEDILRK